MASSFEFVSIRPGQEGFDTSNCQPGAPDNSRRKYPYFSRRQSRLLLPVSTHPTQAVLQHLCIVRVPAAQSSFLDLPADGCRKHRLAGNGGLPYDSLLLQDTRYSSSLTPRSSIKTRSLCSPRGGAGPFIFRGLFENLYGLPTKGFGAYTSLLREGDILQKLPGLEMGVQMGILVVENRPRRNAR